MASCQIAVAGRLMTTWCLASSAGIFFRLADDMQPVAQRMRTHKRGHGALVADERDRAAGQREKPVEQLGRLAPAAVDEPENAQVVPVVAAVRARRRAQRGKAEDADAPGRDAVQFARGRFAGHEKEVAGQARPARFARFRDQRGEDEIARAARAVQFGDERGLRGMRGHDDVGPEAAQQVVQRGAKRERAGLEGMTQPVAQPARGVLQRMDEIDPRLARRQPNQRGLKLARGDLAPVLGRAGQNEDAFHARVIGLASLWITCE